MTDYNSSRSGSSSTGGTYDHIGMREPIQTAAIREFKEAHRQQLEETQREIQAIVDEAKAEAADITIPQYRLECLRLADGNIVKAGELFAFIMGGDK